MSTLVLSWRRCYSRCVGWPRS